MSERNVPEVIVTGTFERVVVNRMSFILMRPNESSYWSVHRVELGNGTRINMIDLGTFFDHSDAISAAIAYTNRPSKADH